MILQEKDLCGVCQSWFRHTRQKTDLRLPDTGKLPNINNLKGLSLVPYLFLTTFLVDLSRDLDSFAGKP